MRHRNAQKKLGRASDHRRALMKNLAKDLFEHGTIVTTVDKAKAVRPYVEKLITKGKRGDLSCRRYLFAHLQDRKLTNKVVDEIAKEYANRPGGYTRIVKMGARRGDASEMAVIQLVKES
jgi:large subunit ribosomal protein L17